MLLFVFFLASPGTITGDQRPDRRRPVFYYDVNPLKSAQYEHAVKKIMAMTEEEMLSFLPDWSSAKFCECPNCYGGVMGHGVFEWSIDRPDQLKCRFCGTVFTNGKYREDGKITGKNGFGEEIGFPFYFSEQKKRSHFLTGHIHYRKKIWLEGQAVALGKAYYATGKEEYARRVVLVLDKLAQRYPHYPVMQNSPKTYRFQDSQKPPYYWDSGKWGEFHNEIPKSMVLAYDLVYGSPEFDRLSRARGYDVRVKLVEDCFRPAYKAVEASPYHVGNVVGFDITSAAILGRVIDEPGYVHRAYGWMKKNLTEGFFFDGMWKEGTASYHYMTVGGIQTFFNAVKGHSDPAGYVDPVDGKRFDALDPAGQFPFLKEVFNAPSKMDWPNGCSSTFHDTHPYEKRSKERNETVSSILPGFGHGSLGRGTGSNQMQAQLHFSGAYGHAHYDSLTMSLFAKGREMVPDIGYTVTQMRYWSTCSLSHNLVVVNRKDQKTADSDGDLLWYFPNTCGVSVIEADGKRSYANIRDLDMYRRMLVMIPVSDENAYIVDIFRLRGGETHDWTMNGDADQDMTAACSLRMNKRRTSMLEPGEAWREPAFVGDIYNPYGMIRDVAYGGTDKPFEVTFQYKSDKTKGIRIHVANDDEAEVWLGQSPSVRRAKTDMRKAWDYRMPKLVVRKKGVVPLHSVFVAVEEPYSGATFISKIERVKLTPHDKNAVALRVTHGNTVDTIISTLDERPYPERRTADRIRFRGRLGVVRQVAGTTAGVWLFDGQELTSKDGRAGNALSRYEGTITGAMRKADGDRYDAFITKSDLPSGKILQSAWIILTHGNGYTHGYEIDSIEKRRQETIIILKNDHGLHIGDTVTKEVFFPRRSMHGPNRFAIPVASCFPSARNSSGRDTFRRRPRWNETPGTK